MNTSSKSILKLSAMIALAGLPAMAMADTITVSVNPYSSSLGGNDYGGEFTAVTGASSQSFVNNGYVASTLMNGGFETFCVESTVDLSSGAQYTFSGTSSTTSVGQTLTLGAAYLYYEFATGNLSGYNYANSPSVASRSYDAGQLQAAIWYLMGGQAGYYGYTSSNISNDSFYKLALTTIGGTSGTYAEASVANDGTYGVAVLNLLCGDTAVQNQLVLTGTGGPTTNGSPVPDGGATMALLGGSLLGAEMLRRKFVPAKA